jgi:hypothetical protein
MTFDEWMKDFSIHLLNDIEVEIIKLDYVAKAAWDHQQKKINELKGQYKQVRNTHELACSWVVNRDEKIEELNNQLADAVKTLKEYSQTEMGFQAQKCLERIGRNGQL